MFITYLSDPTSLLNLTEIQDGHMNYCL